jgi:hypothetical protein
MNNKWYKKVWRRRIGKSMHLRLFLTWKYSSSAFRRYVQRTYKVAKIAARKVSIPAIEAVIERGESVW